jgi:hypothetical protein
MNIQILNNPHARQKQNEKKAFNGMRIKMGWTPSPSATNGIG